MGRKKKVNMNDLIDELPAEPRNEFLQNINLEENTREVDEMKPELKEIALESLSSVYQDPLKKQVLRHRLENSKLCCNYIDKQSGNKLLNKLNSHMKFGFVYLYNVYKTHEICKYGMIQVKKEDDNKPLKE